MLFEACRGLTRGGAQVSEKHSNFLINAGDATAADLEGLGEEVRRRVHAATGVTLEWEIHRIGVPAGKPEAGASAPAGHGRNGAAAFTGANRVAVAHATLHSGDPCPECHQGKVYRQKEPATR